MAQRYGLGAPNGAKNLAGWQINERLSVARGLQRWIPLLSSFDMGLKILFRV
jgi:hypothetical protein